MTRPGLIPNAYCVASAIYAAARELEPDDAGALALAVASGAKDDRRWPERHRRHRISRTRCYAAMALREIFALDATMIDRLVAASSVGAFFSVFNSQREAGILGWFDPETFRRVVEATHRAKQRVIDANGPPEPAAPGNARTAPAGPAAAHIPAFLPAKPAPPRQIDGKKGDLLRMLAEAVANTAKLETPE